MDKQRLSIAMCTYNGTQYLQEQLDSIAAQTRLPDELVVCDDGSSDGTIEMVKVFGYVQEILLYYLIKMMFGNPIKLRKTYQILKKI
jgi:glycosyltransferase involved in cell wall biosynthesis